MKALAHVQRRDDMLSELLRRFMQPMTILEAGPVADIPIDIEESGKEYTVRAEVPGVGKGDLRIEIDGNRVSIAVEARKDAETTESGKPSGCVLVRETDRGSVSRAFSLASDIDDERASAKPQDGVLVLTRPKREGARNRRVRIQ